MRRPAFSSFSAAFCHRLVGAFLVVLLLVATAWADAGRAPKYVFLFIGDGMAVPQRSAAEYVLASRKGETRPGIVKLAMDTLPVQGMTTTYSLNSIITDSAAAGTALATGCKTQNGVLGLNGQGDAVPTVAEMARDKGYRVGIVTSVSLNHATPASFYAHQPSRGNYYEIALDLAKSGFTYFGGGGLIDPTGQRSRTPGDKPNALDAIKAAGYVVADTRADILALKPGVKAVAINPELTWGRSMPYTLDKDPKGLSLAEYTAKGIALLDNPKGFFFMIEGGKIDWACHANDATTAVDDTLAMDQAVRLAMDFAAKHPGETLIVVTGDHECGGLTLGFAGTRYGSYYDYLKYQKTSFERFTDLVDAYKKTHTPETASFDDFVPLIREQYGLIVPTAADLEAMQHAPTPSKTVTSPANPHGMYLKDYELAELKAAFDRTMRTVRKHHKQPMSETDYQAYGDEEPFVVTISHILDHKAGIGWTSFAHTGVPVLTSAGGPGAEAFAGYYDNTDLAKKLMAAMGVGVVRAQK